jgi:uncharacterized protein
LSTFQALVQAIIPATTYFSKPFQTAGGGTCGPKPFTAEDREQFRRLFKQIISQYE